MTEAIPVITGPTAVGKTSLSLELAEQTGAEIVSFDSRQIYRRMDIGTAKPAPDELRQVRHHFIDERPISEPISAGAFATAAWQRICDILDSGRRVVAVGGSTLYLQALTEGLAEIPSVEGSIREGLARRLANEGPAALFEELKIIDPKVASTMDATKTQRIVRALEVYHATGRPLSFYHNMHQEPPFRFSVFVISRDRDELYKRINRRVDQMIERGLIEEVRSILQSNVASDAPPMQTIGYREVVSFLRDELSFDEMRRLIMRNSRRYAKRQLTWFRRNKAYRWLDAGDGHPALMNAITQESE